MAEAPELVFMSGPAAQIDGEDAWRVPVSTRAGARTVVLKILPLRALLTEMLCACLGRALKLPIPRPYLVVVRPSGIRPGFPEEQSAAFGSEEEPYPSVSAILRNKDDVSILLRRWAKVREAAAFDGLIGNEDRTTKNLLLGDQIWLIDHEEALPTWARPDDSTRNELLDLIRAGLNELDLQRLIRDMRAQSSLYPALPLDELASADWMLMLDRAAPELDALVGFVRQRVRYIESLLTAAVSAKQGDLLDGQRVETASNFAASRA